MRHTLTIAAAVLLATLVLALAVPPFIDWSAWGGTLSARLGRALDARVTLGGPISVRLLPSPRFEVGALSLERPGIGLRADAADLEIALAPLLRGNLSIASARMARPRVAIDFRRGADNAPDRAFAALPADVGVERIVLRDAAITVTTDAGTRSLDRIDVTASADSWAGPFKAEGFVRHVQRLVPFRIATGAIAGGRLAIKAESDPLAGLPRSDANGTLVLDAAAPRFEGVLTLSGDIAGAAAGGGSFPWRARFEGDASLENVDAKTVEVRLGDDTTKFVASGSGSLTRDGGVTLDLQSERPDLDRFRASADLSAMRAAVVGLTGTDHVFRLKWRADSALLGSEVLTGSRIDLARPTAAAPTNVDTSFSITREGALAFRGTVDAEGRASGDVALRSADAPALARWLRAIVPTLPATDIPFARVDIAGHAAIYDAHVELSALRATFDRSTMTGRASFVSATTGHGRKFEATLASPALDLDALPDLTQLPTTAKGIDLALTLDAQAIRVARVGQGTVDAGCISLALTRTGDDFAIDHLALENLGGATLRASARSAGRAAHVEASLDAQQLGTLSGLLRRIAPGAWSDAFAARANLLAPANMTLQLDAGRTNDSAFAPTRVSLAGKAADTGIRATISPNADGIAGTLTMEAPEAASFLRQLGVPVISIRGQGAGRIEAKLSGKVGAPFTTIATATIAGATAQFDGALHLDASTAGATGTLGIGARDLGPLLRIVAAPVDAFAGWPVDLRMQIDTRGSLALRDIAGSVATNDVSGTLEKRAASPWTGALRLARLDVGSLAAMLLGPPTGPRTQGLAAQKFATQPNDPPAAEIDLEVARVLTSVGEGGKTIGRLTIGPGAVGVENLSAEIAGGMLSGKATLRRQEDTASLTARLFADRLSVAKPWGTATLSGDVDVKGAGTSPAGLAGTLAGKGHIRLDAASLARTDPDAPLRVAAAVDAERIDLDPATIRTALALAFDAAPQALPAFEQPLSIEAGTASVGPVDLAVGTGQATFAGRYDLAKDRLDLQETLRPKVPADWTGPPPRIDIAIRGPLAAPARTIDATELISTLAAHGLAREEALRQAMDADRRERAFFNRRLRVERAGEAERRAEQAKLELERQAKLEAERQAKIEAERQADAERQEQFRREAARQRDAERILRERQRIERLPTMPAAPLDLRPPAAFVPGRTPSIIAPDPGNAGRY